MAERTRSDAIRDNIMEMARCARDGIDSKHLADGLTSIAAAIENSTIIDIREIKGSFEVMKEVLWAMQFSEHCCSVMEGYAIALRDMLDQLAGTIGIQLTGKTEDTETK